MQPTNERLVWMNETMLVIREFEETMVNVYLEGKLPPHIQKGLAFDIGGGPLPGDACGCWSGACRGWLCAHLRQDNTVVGTHRPHHFAIAKGVPLDAIAAEPLGSPILVTVQGTFAGGQALAQIERD